MLTCREAADPKLLSPLDLAFVGDGVYELLVRTYLTAPGSRPVGQLHTMTVEMVRAEAQAAAYHLLEPLLSEEEQAILRRGRNAHNTKAPRHTDPSQYRRATGVEALFGYLYLSGRNDRLEELFQMILAAKSPETAE